MKINAVVVIYNCKIRNSKTINSLLKISKNHDGYLDFFHLFIFDNSKNSQKENFNFSFNYKYFNDPTNSGLAYAYNYVLNSCGSFENEWLLLLDQDSNLPLNFFSSLFSHSDILKKNTKIFSIVPRMIYNNYCFSPSKVLIGGVHRPIEKEFKGIYKDEIFAVGSASCLRVSFLKKIGGFNELFWLDSLDRWLYLTIYLNEGNVLVSDIYIEHDLSILDYGKFIDLKRYRNIMNYESVFIILYKSKLDLLVYGFRLIKRIIFFLLKKSTKEYAICTFKHLLKLIFMKKRLISDCKNKKI